MIQVSINTRTRQLPFTVQTIAHMVHQIALWEKRVRGAVEISLVGEATMRSLNKRHRGLDQPTDVLSFAWQEYQRLPTASLGELYVCYPYIIKQAKRFNVREREEFVRSLVHGLLHLAGFNHEKKKEAGRMFSRQERLVRRLITDFL